MSEQLVVPSADQPETSLVSAIAHAGTGIKLEDLVSATGKSLDEALVLVERLVARGLVSYNLTTGFVATERGQRLVEHDEYGDFQVKAGGNTQTHNVFDYMDTHEIKHHGGPEKAIGHLKKKLEPHVAKGMAHADVKKAGKCKPGEKMTFGTCRQVGKTESEGISEEGTFAHRSAGARMPVPIQAPNMNNISVKRAEKLKHLAKERERTRERLRQLAQESGTVRRPLKTLRDLTT